MQEKNKSGITPVGVSILVLPDQVEEVTEAGVIVATAIQIDREQMAQTDGEVIAIGSHAYYDEKKEGVIIPRCKVGDRVIMAKYAGMVREGNDGLTYRLIKDDDVKALLDKKEKENV